MAAWVYLFAEHQIKVLCFFFRITKAKTIVIVCDNDLYFRPEDNQIEIEHIAGGELRIYESPWGHCVASPGNDPEFERYLDRAISELLVN